MSSRIPDYSRQAARAAERNRNEPPPPPLDESRFFTRLAQERFHDSLHRRAIIQEKQIAFEDEDVFSCVLESLQERGWIYMLNPPSPISRLLVREFYANVVGGRDDWVVVRRTRCNFSASYINSCLGVPDLPDADDDFWHMFERLAVDWEVIRQVIGVPDAVWVWYEKHKLYPKHMKNKYLSEEARIWMRIMHSHLLPNSHSNTIPQDQCVLLFCLVVGLPINLGKLIYENMRTIPVSAKACGYPSLITGLLQRHNVPLPQNEALIPPPDPIKVAPMKRALNTARKKVRRAITTHRPQGDLPPTSSQPSAGTSSSEFITRQEFEISERRANRRYTSLYKALQAVSTQVLLLMDKKTARRAPPIPPLDPEFLFQGEDDADEDMEDDDADDADEDDEDEDEDAEADDSD